MIADPVAKWKWIGWIKHGLPEAVNHALPFTVGRTAS
jgi:hypothetical protein